MQANLYVNVKDNIDGVPHLGKRFQSRPGRRRWDFFWECFFLLSRRRVTAPRPGRVLRRGGAGGLMAAAIVTAKRAMQSTRLRICDRCRDLSRPDGIEQRYGGARAAHVAVGRDDKHLAHVVERLGHGPQSGGVNAVVIGDKNSHMAPVHSSTLPRLF